MKVMDDFTSGMEPPKRHQIENILEELQHGGAQRREEKDPKEKIRPEEHLRIEIQNTFELNEVTEGPNTPYEDFQIDKKKETVDNLLSNTYSSEKFIESEHESKTKIIRQRN